MIDSQATQYFEHPPRNAAFVSAREQHDANANGTDEENTESKSGGTLSPLLLTALMYTFTIGGAYGIEESVMGGGPLLTIVSVLVMPVLMGLPTSLLVAELGSAMPSNCGFLMWIKVAFPRVVYCTMVLLSFLLVSVDNALYPVVFSEYVCSTMNECSTWTHTWLRLGIILVTFILNIAGIEAVGFTSVILTCLTVSPFILLFLIHVFSTGFDLHWQAISYIPASIHWSTFITTASWNLSGLEQAGTVVEDIKDPQHTILRSLIPLIGLAWLTFLPPLLTGASAAPLNLEEWKTGFWTQVAAWVGGTPLMVFTTAGSILSTFGLTLSALCTTSSMIAGVGYTDVLPSAISRWFSTRNTRFGTYHWAITYNCLVTALFSTFLQFGPLIKVDQFLYGIRITAIMAALFICRHKYPHLKRPYRIPLDDHALYLAFAVPFISFVGLTIIAMVVDWSTAGLCIGVLAGSFIVSWAYCRWWHTDDFMGRIVTIEGDGEVSP